jgi:Pyruvate/2-oxoacid:ferredoxin oxidoreductase delta subunit
MYESPLTLLEGITNQIMEQRENGIYMQVVDQFGVEVDKEELIRALQYDRDQYNKGYRDGKAAAEDELVRCKDCKMYCPLVIAKPYESQRHCTLSRILTDADDFCSYGERKDND